jgi:hypothetical protein
MKYYLEATKISQTRRLNMALNDPVLDGREGPSRGLMPGRDVILLTKGTAFAETRAIIVGTAGDLNIVTAAGVTRTAVPFLAGWSPLRITELLAGGSGDDVWGVY